MSSQQQKPKRKKRTTPPETTKKKREQNRESSGKPRIEKFRPDTDTSAGKQRPAKPKKQAKDEQLPVKKKRKKAETETKSRRPNKSSEKSTKSTKKVKPSESKGQATPRKKKKQPPQSKRPANRKNSTKKTQPPAVNAKTAPKRKQKAPQKTVAKKQQKAPSKAPRKTQNTQKKSSSFALKVIYMISTFATMLILLTFIGLYVVNQNEMTVFNHRVVRLSDNGMANPERSALRTQDLIIVREQAFTQAQPNDIAVFETAVADGYIARRVLSIEAGEEQGYQLSVIGDGQAFGDEAIDAERFVGEVSMSVNNVADVFRFIDQNLILSIIFCVSLIALFILLGIYLFT